MRRNERERVYQKKQKKEVGGSERVVMDSLGIEVDASDSDNMKTLKRMNNEAGDLTYDDSSSTMHMVVTWIPMGQVCSQVQYERRK